MNLTKTQQILGEEFTINSSQLPGVAKISTPYRYPDDSEISLHYQIESQTLTDMAQVSIWISKRELSGKRLDKIFTLFRVFFFCRGYEMEGFVIHLNVSEDCLADEVKALGKYIEQFCNGEC